MPSLGELSKKKKKKAYLQEAVSTGKVEMTSCVGCWRFNYKLFGWVDN